MSKRRFPSKLFNQSLQKFSKEDRFDLQSANFINFPLECHQHHHPSSSITRTVGRKRRITIWRDLRVSQTRYRSGKPSVPVYQAKPADVAWVLRVCRASGTSSWSKPSRQLRSYKTYSPPLIGSLSNIIAEAQMVIAELFNFAGTTLPGCEERGGGC
jgi:hypothetical protein